MALHPPIRGRGYVTNALEHKGGKQCKVENYLSKFKHEETKISRPWRGHGRTNSAADDDSSSLLWSLFLENVSKSELAMFFRRVTKHVSRYDYKWW